MNNSSRPRLAVIGGGIAGMSFAATVAGEFDVTVFEAEFQPGYHSSGRSATVYYKAAHNDLLYRITNAAEPMFLEPPKGYATLAHQINRIVIALPDEIDQLRTYLDTWIDKCPWLTSISGSQLKTHCPILRDSYQDAVLDSQTLSLDIHNLLDGHRRKVLERQGTIRTRSRLQSAISNSNGWSISLADGETHQCDILVNAAGAWADHVARACGVKPINLTPKRRTALHVKPAQDPSKWAMVYRVSEGLYFKPEGPVLMVSPEDEHDSAPTDAQPEMLDIAITVDEFQKTTTESVERPERTWAGLRSFAPDRLPVIGFDSEVDNFFWLAAFGGFGILTSPFYAPFAHDQLPGIQRRLGSNAVSPNELSVHRLRATDNESSSNA